MKLVLAILYIFISATASAGIFDLFKDPATLILNQKDCYLASGAGEIVDGSYIVKGVAIVVKLKKLDKNRLSFESLGSEGSAPFVVNVRVEGKQVITYAPNGSTLIYCNLN